VTLEIDQNRSFCRGTADAAFVPLISTAQTCYCCTTSSVKDLLSIAEI
jgi:hypothetical protein